MQQLPVVPQIIRIGAGIPRRVDAGAPPSASTSNPESSARTISPVASATVLPFLRAFSRKLFPSSTISGIAG